MEEHGQKQTTDNQDSNKNLTFTGNIFIFHAFDVGEDINLEKVEKLPAIICPPPRQPKYFKNYHIPLAIELPHPHSSSRSWSCNIHTFGAISIVSKITFNATLEELLREINDIDNKYQEQSVMDVKAVFKKIKKCISKPKFFQMKSSYLVVQVDPQPQTIDVKTLQQHYESVIASLLWFEHTTLSEYQKNEIMQDVIGYYRGDLVVIDTEAAFVYDPEYEELLDFFEFANIQLVELRYFDWLLDQHLNIIYEEKVATLPLSAYLPFIGTRIHDPVTRLARLRVDISVITERLENSIKIMDEAYFSEMYNLLVKKLDLENWKKSIDKKLDIIKDVRQVYQSKVDTLREDLLNVLIIVLIFFELIFAILTHYKN